MEPSVCKIVLKGTVAGSLPLLLLTALLGPSEFVLGLLILAVSGLIVWWCEERPDSGFGRWLRR